MKELQMYRYFFVGLASIILTSTYFNFHYTPAETVKYVMPPISIIIDGGSPQPDVIDYDQLECLALNVYHEARGESVEGQVAVSQVVMNRVRDRRFPNTICEVIYQGQISQWYLEAKGEIVPLRNRCQFSWWCDGRSDRPRNMSAWGQALEVAAGVMRGEYSDITHGAMWYHASYVDPSWRYSLLPIASIGDHHFYKQAPL